MGLRVAWFGHAGGRRADGLSAYSAQTVAALVAAGCTVRFFHHDADGDRTPVDDAVALDGVRFKTVTLPVPGTRARIEKALAEFRPDVVHCSLSVSLLDGAAPHAPRHRRAERPRPHYARDLPLPQPSPPRVRPLHRSLGGPA